jgi:6-pyruvoyltetrahydropterin/6-carboxytetrahydropterin synthase
MYELTVEREFCAAHAITINGHREPVHGHNWRVRVIVIGGELDSNGLLCDFHVIERELDGIIKAFDNNDLNATPPFDRLNPTAEHVARHIAQRLQPKMPRNITLKGATVTEAPGCSATFWLQRP